MLTADLDLAFNGLHVPKYEFDEGRQPVWCISPFERQPMMDAFKEIWLDANLLSQSAWNPNIAALVRVANARSLYLNPMLALAEFNRGHGVLEAGDLLVDKIPRFEEFYNVLFDMERVVTDSLMLRKHVQADCAYIKLLADTVLVIRYFYNRGKLSFSQRLEGFAKLIREHLPLFLATFYVACVYFFAKEPQGRALLGKSLCAKIDADMAILSGQNEKNYRRAQNLASDLALHTRTTEFPLTPSTARCRIPYIATSDKGFALLLREIGYLKVKIDRHTRVGKGSPAFRRDGIMISNCPNSVGDIFFKYLSDVPVDMHRLTTLDTYAKAIAGGTFDHTKV